MYNLRDWVTTVFVILAEQSGVHRGAMPNQPVYCLGKKTQAVLILLLLLLFKTSYIFSEAKTWG